MRINITAAGRIKEPYLREGVEEFVKRLKPYCRLVITESGEEKAPDNPSAAQRRQALDKEGEKLLATVKDEDFVIVLDVKGQNFSSEELAGLLAQKALTGEGGVTFIIGGAYGLSERVRRRGDLLMSFSAFTFTHQMVRLLLIEQIYRAFKIWRGEKYHN